jgi:hypothetical protein
MKQRQLQQQEQKQIPSLYYGMTNKETTAKARAKATAGPYASLGVDNSRRTR